MSDILNEWRLGQRNLLNICKKNMQVLERLLDLTHAPVKVGCYYSQSLRRENKRTANQPHR